MTKNIILFSTFLVTSFCFTQQNLDTDGVSVHGDKRINQLVEIEKRIDQIQGYRLQICFDSNKDIVDAARDKFLKLYPLTDTYVIFENPHFNLKVGDFRSRLEAEKVQRELFGEFVICIIHEELINLPRID
mgnify:CR=1 FL=1|jgi:hypothetical protein